MIIYRKNKRIRALILQCLKNFFRFEPIQFLEPFARELISLKFEISYFHSIDIFRYIIYCRVGKEIVLDAEIFDISIFDDILESAVGYGVIIDGQIGNFLVVSDISRRKVSNGIARDIHHFERTFFEEFLHSRISGFVVRQVDDPDVRIWQSGKIHQSFPRDMVSSEIEGFEQRKSPYLCTYLLYLVIRHSQGIKIKRVSRQRIFFFLNPYRSIGTIITVGVYSKCHSRQEEEKNDSS